jgi:transcriptional regulator with XRE-family HTH domain
MAGSLLEIAHRLERTREALGFANQVEFCKEIGVEKNIYNPFEKGRRRITVDAAIKIRKRFNIPLDWIFCGDPSGLPAHLYRKLNIKAA